MEQTQTPSPLARVPQGAAAGVAIAAASLVTLLSIAHHPTMSKALAPGEAIPALIAMSRSDQLVHATVIATMLAMLFGFVVYALRRGLYRSAVIGGLIAFTFGVAATLGAALIDGFLIPEIAAQFAGATAAIMNKSSIPLMICALAIQVATKAGLVGMSLGIVLWSADLTLDAGYLRIAGIVGVLAGIVPAILTLSGGSIGPHALIVVLTIQTLWYLTIATALLQRRV